MTENSVFHLKNRSELQVFTWKTIISAVFFCKKGFRNYIFWWKWQVKTIFPVFKSWNSQKNQFSVEKTYFFDKKHQNDPELLQRTPELGHIINAPNMMRQTMEMMRNPNMMNEMMRNHDQAIRNLQVRRFGSIF